jgi:BCD family chlorophyll transporter-like MFS transporter
MNWLGIFRLALVQAALGSMVVLVTSTLNRVMTVEYALPAVLPGALVAFHYAVQMIRPRLGFGSDRGARRTPWVVCGMAVLAGGTMLCALATVWMPRSPLAGFAFAVLGYGLVGLGVGAAGTSLLVMLAKQVDDRRRAAAASIMWILMIAGFAVTSTLVGHFLDPFSPLRLLRVTGTAVSIALLVAWAAVWRVERVASARATPLENRAERAATFTEALRAVWNEPQARAFTLFVFVSMLAYSAEELLLEPFCGLVFGFSLGESARMSGLWHTGVLLGMIAVGVIGSGGRYGGWRPGGRHSGGRRSARSLRLWTVGGCAASALAVAGVAAGGVVGNAWPIKTSVIALGIANGVFAVSAIGSMMELAHRSAGAVGVRMGLWGAAQAIAFALGGLLGTGTVDLIRQVSGSATTAFSIVFGIEAVLFLAAAQFAARVAFDPSHPPASNSQAVIA